MEHTKTLRTLEASGVAAGGGARTSGVAASLAEAADFAAADSGDEKPKAVRGVLSSDSKS